MVPAATPVTIPLPFTVAIVVLDETHGVVVAAVILPVSCVVNPTQILLFPIIVGLAFTVMVCVFEHPKLFV